MTEATLNNELRDLDNRIAVLDDKVRSIVFDMKAFGITDSIMKAYNNAYFELETLRERRACKGKPDERVAYIKSAPMGNY